MPKLLKVRMANIPLDNGNKIIPDITWTPDGKSTLFLLENGGGKTSFIQLFLQTILPNTSLAGRALKDLISKGTTGHIAAKWRLDGDYPKFLTLGFTFLNERGRQQNELKYFTYLFPNYGDEDALTIDDLPFTEDQHITTYSELRKFLQKQKDARVKIFDTQYEYREEMRKYQFLPEEWESVRKINGDEGAVEGFFEKTKTESQLIRRLLIPSVEEATFQSSGLDEIFRSFQEYQKNLLRIPELKKDLQDFHVFREHGGIVLREVEALQHRKNEFGQYVQDLHRFQKGLLDHQVDLEQEKATREVEQHQLYQQQADLDWKLSSYPIHKKQAELQDKERDFADTESKLNQKQQALADAEVKKNELIALREFHDYQQNLNHVNKYKAKLEALEKQEPELQAELKLALQALFISWNQTWKEMDQQVTKTKSNILDLGRKLEESSKHQKEIELEQRSLVGNHSKLQTQYNNYEIDWKELSADVECSSYDQLPYYLDKIKREQSRLQQELNQLGAEVVEVNEKVDSLRKKDRELDLQKHKLEYKKKTVEEDLATYESELEKLKEAVSTLPYHVEDIWKDKDNLLGKMAHVKEQAESQYQNMSYKVHEIADQIEELSHDFYVPHPQLLEAKNLLENKGVIVTLGSEWLSEQPIPSEEKKAFLEQFPLLPFSLLFEERQIPRIRQALKQWESKKTKIPLLFQKKETLQLGQPVDEPSIMFDLQNGTFVYPLTDTELFVSKEWLRKHIAELEQSYQEQKDQLAGLEERKNTVGHLSYQIQTFFSRYTKEKAEGYTNQIRVYEDMLNDLEAKLKETKDLINHYKQKSGSIKEHILDLQSQKGKLGQKQDRVERFLSKHIDPNEIKKQINVTETLLSKLESTLSQLKEEEDRLRTQKENVNAELVRKQGELDSLIDTGKQYDFTPDPLYNSISTCSYNDCKSKVDGLMETLDKKVGEKKSIQDAYQTLKQSAERKRESIEALKVPFDWLEKNQRKVSLAEITNAQDRIASIQSNIEAITAQLDNLKQKISRLKGVIEYTINQLIKDYGREPFAYTNGQTEYEQYKLESDRIDSSYQKVTERMKQLANDLSKIKHVLTRFSDLEYLPPCPPEITPWKSKDWNNQPDELFEKLKRNTSIAKFHLDTQQTKAQNAYSKFYDELARTYNQKVKSFSREFQNTMRKGRQFDYQYISQRFEIAFDALVQLEEAVKITLSQSEQDKEKLINLIYRRVETLYESIMEMPKHSKIELFHQTFYMLRIKWNRFDEQASMRKIELFMNNLLLELQQMKYEGKGEDEVSAYLRDQLEPIKLLQHYAPVEDCRIEIFKPRNESLLKEGIEYVSWTQASSWSGGERYVAYMTMFMVLITHLRNRLFARNQSWKVIVADNPFGKASSDHVVKPIIQLAKKSKIQLFFLTAIKEEGIRKHFPTVYSNRYYRKGGREILHTNLHLGNIYYKSMNEEE